MNISKPPISRIVKEGTTGDCPICKSTMLKEHEWIFFRWGETIGCVQPECENYFNSKQNKRNKTLKKLGI